MVDDITASFFPFNLPNFYYIDRDLISQKYFSPHKTLLNVSIYILVLKYKSVCYLEVMNLFITAFYYLMAWIMKEDFFLKTALRNDIFAR